MPIFLFWLLAAVGVGAIARGKARSFFGFFLLSFFLSPIVGLIVVLICQHGGKQCPSCAENVKLEAQKCKHCGHTFTAPETKDPSS